MLTRTMKSPHDFAEPLPFLTDGRSNLTEKSSSCATGSLKKGNWTGKVSDNLVHKKKDDESNNSVEDRRSYSPSPYYKGLLCHEKVSGITTQPESTTPIGHDVQNSLSPSPYYKGLLYTERVDHGTSTGTGTTLEVETTTAIPHEYLVSPYYKGLLYTERIDHGTSTTDTCTTLEVETTAAIPHEYLISPYYKGLLNPTTGPDCESVPTAAASSSSRMSFSVNKPKVGFFKFKPKDERSPTLVKVYSTGNLSDQESLRDRGSEPTSPQFSPPLPPPEPPTEPPLPPPFVLQFDAFGALCILR